MIYQPHMEQSDWIEFTTMVLTVILRHTLQCMKH